MSAVTRDVVEGRSRRRAGVERVEAAPDVGEAEVADDEEDAGVVLVEGPAAGGEREGGGRAGVVMAGSWGCGGLWGSTDGELSYWYTFVTQPR